MYKTKNAFNTSTEIHGYPSPLVSPEVKNTKEYISQYIKQMYSDHVNNNKSLYDYQKLSFADNRRYSEGNQGIQKYKDLMDGQGDQSFMNLDWSPIAIIPKFVDVIIGGMMNQEFDVMCNAIDPSSANKRKEQRAELLTDMKMKDVSKKLKDIGIDIEQGRPALEDEEEVNLYMDLNYKQAAEIAMEQAIKFVMEAGDFEVVREQLLNDLVVLGICGIKTETDVNGQVKVRYVDPQRLITSYSSSPDFRDMVHAGEVVKMTIRDLKKQAGEQFSDEDYEEMASMVSGRYGNQDRANNRGDYGHGGQPYDEFTIEVLDAEFLAVDTYKFEKKKNKFGGYSFNKKDFDYDPPKNSKYKREQKNIQVKNRYVGKYIIGTDYVFDFGRAKNQERPRGFMSETMLSYSIFSPGMKEMRFKSLVSRMIPFADQIQLAHLKIQQLVAKARPKGLAIEVGGLENVTKGDGGATWDPLELQSIYDQTGNFYYRRLDDEGNASSGPPIMELENGIGRDLGNLISIYNYNLERIRDVTGINEARDGSTPSKDSLIGVQKMALMSSNNATRGLNNAYFNIIGRASRSIVRRVQDVVNYLGEFEIYDQALGTAAVNSFKDIDDMRDIDFGVFIDVMPDEEQKQLLEQNIQVSIANKELRIEDAILIRSIKNNKLANRMLIYRRKKYMEDLQKQAQSNAQANSQQQQQSVQMAGQMKQQETQQGLMVDAEKMKMEFDLKEKFAQAEHKRKMELLELSKQLEGNNQSEIERERSERKGQTQG